MSSAAVELSIPYLSLHGAIMAAAWLKMLYKCAHSMQHFQVLGSVKLQTLYNDGVPRHG
jgi:hypothetical protein